MSASGSQCAGRIALGVLHEQTWALLNATFHTLESACGVDLKVGLVLEDLNVSCFNPEDFKDHVDLLHSGTSRGVHEKLTAVPDATTHLHNYRLYN